MNYTELLESVPKICTMLDIEDMVSNYISEHTNPKADEYMDSMESMTRTLLSDLFLSSTITVEDNRYKVILFEIGNTNSSTSTRYHYFAIYSRPDLNNLLEKDTLVPTLKTFVMDVHINRRDTLSSVIKEASSVKDMRLISINKKTEMEVWNSFLTLISKNTAYGIMYLPGKLVSDDSSDFHENFYIQKNSFDFPGYIAQYITDHFEEIIDLSKLHKEFLNVIKETSIDDYLYKSLSSLEQQVVSSDKVIDLPIVKEVESSKDSSHIDKKKWKQIMEDTCTIVGNSEDTYLRYHFNKIINIFEETRSESTISDDSIVEDFYLSVYRAFSRVSSIKPTCTNCTCGDKGKLVSSTIESTTEDLVVNKDRKEIHIHIHL